ncbi:DUF1330 domain-containing protein [Arcobacter sp. FWKO B]|uniref:DUF1330 domain-containing protein n=1 Tax=Arcobacter sp. FWKO B TaxID=2593672 RepID=UPI0018A491E8|nr:DUF1330 domain-containing protein [Arcobacter sp. FWKO B]QOG12797.1 DUF1330 domain-containing protein [Arcobacter sp. FWKO B]
MAVYVIGQIKIKNQDKWQEYKNQVADTLIPYGGKVLFRGTQIDSFVGVTEYPDVVAIEFGTADIAKQWYQSKEYQSLVEVREKGADIILHVYG